MENEKKSKKGFWAKVKTNACEALLELILGLICLAVGIGILALFGQAHLLARMNPELIVLIGVLAVLAVVGIVIAIIAVVKKKKK